MAAALRWTYLLLIALLCACNEHKANDLATHNMSPRETLSRAEELMQTQPDSALMLLEDLSKGALRGRENRAHFALLYSQALDKNYIDRSNDSIIRVAVDYYSTRRSEPEKLFLSYYYLGRVQQNAGNLTRAMLSYGQAEELVAEIQDDYAIGLLYAQMGNLYHAVYDLPKSLDCFQKAYIHYEKADKELHKMYAKRDVGVLYMDLNQYDIAEEYLSETLQWSLRNQRETLCQNCVEFMLSLYSRSSKMNKYKEFYETHEQYIEDKFLKINALIEISIHENNLQKAGLYIEQAWAMADERIDTTYLCFREYELYKSTGNYTQAINKIENIYYAQDTLVRGVLQQPLLSAQRDYFKSQSELNELKLLHNKQKQIFVSIILIIIMLSAIVFVRQRLKAKAQEINQYLDKVQDLESELLVKERNLQAVSESNSQMNEQINMLFAKHFATIDQLSATYYEMHAVKNEKEAVYKSVKKEIENFSKNKKTLQELENIVNQHKNNVMAILREEFPEFSEMDFRLICYSIAGFSAKAISVFTGNSTGNIYMKKSRLKAKINASDIAQKEIITKALD